MGDWWMSDDEEQKTRTLFCSTYPYGEWNNEREPFTERMLTFTVMHPECEHVRTYVWMQVQVCSYVCVCLSAYVSPRFVCVYVGLLMGRWCSSHFRTLIHIRRISIQISRQQPYGIHQPTIYCDPIGIALSGRSAPIVLHITFGSMTTPLGENEANTLVMHTHMNCENTCASTSNDLWRLPAAFRHTNTL